jgi:hypothetical protein
MCGRIGRNFLITVCFIVIGAAFSLGQAVFTVGSTPAVVADIGYTESSGAVTLVVVSGVTVASPITITYSAPITNNDQSEIVISGTMAGVSLELDRTHNLIRVNIPFGGSVGDQITISNVRVSVAGSDFSPVTATLRSPLPSGNAILAGQTIVTVVAQVMEPFSFDQSADPLSYGDGMVLRAVTTLKVVEQYADALVGSALDVGRIRITPFPSIPEGLQITFPATVVSAETGSVFTTLSGVAETIPRDDGTTDVVYQLMPGMNSILLSESFDLTPTMEGAATGAGIIQFQAELLPIGLEVPNDEYPSTDIPRYASRLVPDEIDLISGAIQLFFPFRIQSEDTYTGLALTNPENYRVRATLTAYDAAGNVIAGAGITNPVPVDLPRNGQYAKLATELFGDDFNASSSGFIKATAQNPSLKGFYLTGDMSGPKLDGGIGNLTGALSWYMPVVFHQGSAPFNRLELYNPGSSTATATLKLIDINGNQVAVKTKTVAAGNLYSSDVTDIFEKPLISFQGGYIRGDSDLPLIVQDTFGNALESNVLTSQGAPSLTSYSIPHFASGDHYSTELTMVNTDVYFPANLVITLFDNDNQQISDPVEVEINPGAQMIRTIASLFPNLGSGLATGSINIEVLPVRRGPFITYPPLVGAVRFANIDGSASAAIPLLIAPSNDIVYSHVAQSQGWFTGVTVLNPNTIPTNMVLDVFASDGTLTGTYWDQLQPGQRFAKLVYELVPESAGQSGGYIRIFSDSSLTSFSLFGSDDLKSLSAIPPQGLQ